MTDKPKQREVVVQPRVHPDFTPKVIRAFFSSDIDALIPKSSTIAYINFVMNLKMYLSLDKIKHDELKTRIQWVIEQTGISPTDTYEELEKKLVDTGYYQRNGLTSIMDRVRKEPIEYFAPANKEETK